MVERQLAIANLATESAMTLLQPLLDRTEAVPEQSPPATVSAVPVTPEPTVELQPTFGKHRRQQAEAGEAPVTLPPVGADGLMGGDG